MMRCDGCALLTKIASSEMIDSVVGKWLLKARDVCVCSPNKILDVVIDDETRESCKCIAQDYLNALLDTHMLNKDMTCDIMELNIALDTNFEAGCDMFLKDRCSKCPNLKEDAI